MKRCEFRISVQSCEMVLRVAFVAMALSLLVVGCGNHAVESGVPDAATESEVGFTSVDSQIQKNSAEASSDVEASSSSVIKEEGGETPPPSEDVGVSANNSESPDSQKRNSLNMLNYMTALAQKVDANRKDKLFLDTAYDSFDNLYPNSVDRETQAQIATIMDTIQEYRMMSVKRDRIEQIYEQNRAQALRSAIPNPLGLLSAVESKDMVAAVTSALYMVVDSATSYQTAASQADEQFIEDGWECDDEEARNLHSSILSHQDYMLDMVRNYDIEGDKALNKQAVSSFVSWSSKDDSELERKIAWLESASSRKTYLDFGPYWLELASEYYKYGSYEKCLEAVKSYEAVSSRIFRRDTEYASVLPMAITSAKQIMEEADYVKIADGYCEAILANTGDEDWSLRYFAAQIYIDLFSVTGQRAYLDKAYDVARENVVVLVDEQRELNDTYLQDIQKVEVSWNPFDNSPKNMEAKNYNRALEQERKIALPPVSEALYLNCDLLFAAADKKGIGQTEREKIDRILHADEKPIFLTEALDSRFWFDETKRTVTPDTDGVEFSGDSFVIPASCVTDRSVISLTVTDGNGDTTFDDWRVVEVRRPKDSTDCSEFTASYVSESAGKREFKAGEKLAVRVVPVAESPSEFLEFGYDVVATKNFLVFDGVAFERSK